MQFKLWKIGVLVAFFVAVADALGVYIVAEHVIWGKVIAFAIIKGLGGAALYMKTHPVEQLNLDDSPSKPTEAPKETMKNIVSILLIAAAVALLPTRTPAQVLTNTATELVPAPVTQVVNFFTTPSTNWYAATYGIINTETDEVGVGVAAFYKVNDFVGAFLGLDQLGGQLYMPSGNFQLQLPLKLFNRLDVIPFARTGIAIPVGRGNDDPNVAGILGAGWAVRLPEHSAWYIPNDVIVDVEKWTNVQGLQVRGGLVWKF